MIFIQTNIKYVWTGYCKIMVCILHSKWIISDMLLHFLHQVRCWRFNPGQTLGNYSLENIQLEYETVHYIDLAQHVTLIKTVVWSSTSTLINENVNIPQQSMHGIVFLFRPTSLADSENFVYPNINEVN